MNNWEKSLLPLSSSIRDAIKNIDSNPLQIAVIVDEQQKLLGIITDKDIRQGMLKQVSLDDSVQVIMNTTPVVASTIDTREQILKLFQQTNFLYIPVVDDKNHVIRIEQNNVHSLKQKENWVVLMAGGMGTRLKPLTQKIPKPLLKVGNKPLLETILENFIEDGFHKFFISVNYKSEMIKEHFEDGSQWNVDISYIQETEKMGTAGALSLLSERPAHPFIVMNGDLLTKINFQHLLDFHCQHTAQGTMCIREYDFQVPFGVVDINHHRIVNINEKPVQRFFVNAGIYVLEPEVLKLIPKQTFYNMPDLFNYLVEHEYETSAFPIREYWLDIGHMKDFERANGEFQENFQ